MAKAIIVDQELTGLCKSIQDAQLRELFMALMLHQSSIYLDVDVLRGISITSYVGSESVIVRRVDDIPYVYTVLEKEFPGQVSICMFQMDSFRFVFVNEAVEVLNANRVVREMFKEGLIYRLLNCVGAP